MLDDQLPETLKAQILKFPLRTEKRKADFARYRLQGDGPVTAIARILTQECRALQDEVDGGSPGLGPMVYYDSWQHQITLVRGSTVETFRPISVLDWDFDWVSLRSWMGSMLNDVLDEVAIRKHRGNF